MADLRAEIFVNAREILERYLAPLVNDPHSTQTVAIHLARPLADDLLAILTRPLLRDADLAKGSKSLDVAVSARANRDVADLVREAEARWKTETAAATLGTLADIGQSLHELLEEAWFTAVRDFPRLMDAAPMAASIAVFGGADAVFAVPPIATREAGGVRLSFWTVAFALQSLGDQVSAEIAQRDSFNEVLLGLSELARLQWAIADHVGVLSGSDRVGLAWYSHARAYAAGASERVAAIGQRGFLREPPSLLVKHPGLELKLACQALDYIAEGRCFQVPAIRWASLTQGDRPRGFRLMVNHPLVSVPAARAALQHGLRFLGRGQEQGLSTEEDQFLQALRVAGLPERDRAPRGFWETFARQWNENRPDNPETVNALRVRYHRLRRKVER